MDYQGDENVAGVARFIDNNLESVFAPLHMNPEEFLGEFGGATFDGDFFIINGKKYRLLLRQI
jgi:hypothetical protein